MPRTNTAAGAPGASRSVPGGTRLTKVRTATGAATRSNGIAIQSGGPLMATRTSGDRSGEDDARSAPIGAWFDGLAVDDRGSVGERGDRDDPRQHHERAAGRGTRPAS